jgi:hypothetical protein
MSFFSISYWFTTQPPEVGGYLGQFLFVVFFASFVLGIVGRIATDRRRDDRYVRKIGNRISSLLVTMGSFGLLLYFFGFEDVYFFGARFWYPVWSIATVVWAYYIVRYIKKDVPEMRARESSRKAKNKYIPGRKK